MRISLLTLIAAASFTLSACSDSSGNGGGDVKYKSPEPEYQSQLGSGAAYVGYGDFTDVAEKRLKVLSVDKKPHNERDSCYSYTKHPIILVHGLYGFDDILGIKIDLDGGLPLKFAPGKNDDSYPFNDTTTGIADKGTVNKGIKYWYDVSEAIELGGGLAIAISVPKLNSTEKRGEELITKLTQLQNEVAGKDLSSQCGSFDFSKFHLMGHSHGGPTVRYVLAEKPEILASVTTIGGLNVYGIPETDVQAAYKNDGTPKTNDPLNPLDPNNVCTKEYRDSLASQNLFFPGVKKAESDAYPWREPICNDMADTMAKLTSFTYGPLFQGSMNLLAELIEFVGGDKQNDQSNAAASLTSLSAEGIAKYNAGDITNAIPSRTLGLPDYHQLFKYDDDISQRGALFGLGLKDPCTNNYYSDSRFVVSGSNVFGNNKDSCAEKLHGAAFAKKTPSGYEDADIESDTPDPDSIFLFSWSGTRDLDVNTFDPTDYLTAAAACLLGGLDTNCFTDKYKEEQANRSKLANLEPSDGMVQQFSSHFGTVLNSDYNLNHLDEINWLFNSYSKEGSSKIEKDPSFTPLAIYRIQANRLQQLECSYQGSDEPACNRSQE